MPTTGDEAATRAERVVTPQGTGLVSNAEVIVEAIACFLWFYW